MDGDEMEDVGESPLSAAALRTIFNSVDAAIFVHDETGEIIDVNRGAADMYGHSRSELRAGNVETTSSGEGQYTQANAEKRIERAAQGESQRFEWRGQDSDGNEFWEDVSLTRTVVDGDVRILAIVRDIDDRKEAERRFETLIDNLPGVVYRCRNEPGWPMEFVGGQCKKLTGYEAEAVESGDVSWGKDIIHPDDQEWVQEEVQPAIAAGEPFELTYRIRTASGEVRYVWERGQQVPATSSPEEVLEGFITDVTDRERHEQQLADQRDRLEVLNEVLRHDIRNDLQLVTAYADLLEEWVDDDSEGQEHVDALIESADHAVELTKTARTMANVMLQTTEEKHEVDVHEVLCDLLEQTRAAHDGVVLTVEGSLPPATVMANDMLESVFQNLLQNAIQHNDTETPHVTVTGETEDGSFIVRVADDGPGIPDDQKESVFGKGEAGLESGGTGLGLYLVQTLVDMYDGEVWVEDNEPRGSVFVVELPTVG